MPRTTQAAIGRDDGDLVGILESLPVVSRPPQSERSRHHAVDTLATMERRGSITSGMRLAGETFRTVFRTAELDPLQAIDREQQRKSVKTRQAAPPAPSRRIEAARAEVWGMIVAVGGMGSPAGSCLWHVVGCERTIKQWALEQGWCGRRVSQEAAAGILIAALGMLETQFLDGIDR
jgi:hypothetical protein